MSTGKSLWRRDVEKALPDRRSKPNDPATPTPVTDGANLYVLFPDVGLIFYIVEWSGALARDGRPFNPPHGMPTSPILFIVL